jgi:hypothetical protein
MFGVRRIVKDRRYAGGAISALAGGGISGCLNYYPSSLLLSGAFPHLYMDQFGSEQYRGRQVERMLKCGSCGTQYLLRQLAEVVDKSPLVELKCKSCGGDLEVSK